jgi:hypothetical protein
MVIKRDSHKSVLTDKRFADREFLESFFARRLRAFAEKLFEGKTYGGLGPDDLVQATYTRVVNEEEWRGQSERSLMGRLRTTMRHDFIDLTRKYGSGRHADLSDEISIQRPGKRTEKAQTDAERESYARFLITLELLTAFVLSSLAFIVKINLSPRMEDTFQLEMNLAWVSYLLGLMSFLATLVLLAWIKYSSAALPISIIILVIFVVGVAVFWNMVRKQNKLA